MREIKEIEADIRDAMLERARLKARQMELSRELTAAQVKASAVSVVDGLSDAEREALRKELGDG